MSSLDKDEKNQKQIFKLQGDFYALLNHRKSFLTSNKREGMKLKVIEEIAQKNPLKPEITKKSVNIAEKASQGEFRRSRRLS